MDRVTMNSLESVARDVVRELHALCNLAVDMKEAYGMLRGADDNIGTYGPDWTGAEIAGLRATTKAIVQALAGITPAVRAIRANCAALLASCLAATNAAEERAERGDLDRQGKGASDA